VYRSAMLGLDKKSVAFSFVLRGADHTLTDEEIAKAMSRIQRVAAEKYNAILRG